MFGHREAVGIGGMKLWTVAAVCMAATAPLILATNSASQQRAETSAAQCRVQEMDPRRGPARQTFCLGANGQWQARPDIPVQSVGAAGTPSASGPMGGELPYGWRGQISYSGTQQGYSQRQQRAPRRLTLGTALEALAGGEREEFGGPYQLQLTIDGDAVSGTYSGAPGSGIRPGRIAGTRNGSRCRLFADDILIEAECTADRFVGNGRSQGNSRVSQTLRIDARATDVVDAAEEERQAAEAAAQDAAQAADELAQAEVERAAAEAGRAAAAAAERARIASMPAASSAQTALLERTVRQDAQAWRLNRYDAGSMSNVRASSIAGGLTLLRGDYTYNGGSRGWVEARVTGGRVECLGYWDVGGCALPRGTVAVASGPAAPTRAVPPGAGRSGGRRLASADYIPILDRIITTDAQSWHYNRYLTGSVTNPSVTRDSQDSVTSVRGDYRYITFGAEAEGWIEVRMSPVGSVSCIKYHDYPDQCRAIGDTTRFTRESNEARSQRETDNWNRFWCPDPGSTSGC